MKDGKKLAMLFGGIGTLICILMFFVKSEDSFMLTLGVWFSIFAIAAIFVLFLYYKFADIKKHPAHKKEMGLVTLFIVVSIAVGALISFVFGVSPMQAKGGVEYGTFAVLSMSTLIFTPIVLILIALFFALKSLIIKK